VTTPATVEPGGTTSAPGPRHRTGTRLLALLTGVALATAGIAASVWLTTGSTGASDGTGGDTGEVVPVAWGRPAVSADGLVQRSGVRITQVAVTGGGGLVDLRYQVVDPEAANALHDPRTPPAVIDEDTGLVVHHPFMDHAHSGPYTAGVTYYVVLDNPQSRIHPGSVVTVLLGDAQVEHVVVE
jgi:hypothetical protein